MNVTRNVQRISGLIEAHVNVNVRRINGVRVVSLLMKMLVIVCVRNKNVQTGKNGIKKIVNVLKCSIIFPSI